MEDQTRVYLIEIAVKTLGTSYEQARLRLEAFLQSGILDKFKNPTPDETIFQIIVDVAMSILQLNSTRN